MASILVVPIHLDAMLLERDKYVTSPTADFTRLPYSYKGVDVNGDVPYLSEILLSQPFQDQNLQLRTGIHLHWALPDALTMAEHDKNGTRFRSVPNRWMVTRRNKNNQIEQQWIVESDYLSEEDNGSINYPYIKGQFNYEPSKPFVYLGRKLRLVDWQSSSNTTRYLKSLTAFGHGEPTFAAFYPNCHSVFGFFDPTYKRIGSLQGLCYELIGWYADPSQDILKPFKTDSNWLTTLKEELGWSTTEDIACPERIVCYAQLKFNPDLSTPPHTTADDEEGVSIGNSPTEALAAHLSQQPEFAIPTAEQAQVENILEALAYADQLEQVQFDLDANLLENRHNSSFHAVPSGILWTIQQADDRDEAVDLQQLEARQKLELPPDLGPQLNLLNIAQQNYDQAQHEIEGLREQIFADWYKYMLCVYHPEASGDTYPDVDKVKFFIEKNIENLNRKIDAAGIDLPVEQENTLAHKVHVELQATVAQLESFNAEIFPATKAQYDLRPLAAPQYYLPNEPVVLLTGKVGTPSDRHGQDGANHSEGLLECFRLEVDHKNFATPEDVIRVHEKVVDKFKSLPPNIALKIWDKQPWHPILLQWEIEYFPVRQPFDADSPSGGYKDNFIEQHYVLPEQKVELELREGQLIPNKGSNVYSGTSILSPVAAPLVMERISSYLAKHHDVDDPTIRILKEINHHLEQNSGSNLSQVLGGLNKAFIMQKLTRQLPIADPLGFEPYKTFTEQGVRQAVKDYMTHAPQPFNDFNPVRAGALRILQMSLVDNFGVSNNVPLDKITTPKAFSVKDHPGWIALPPRLAQPARINFRWLDASHNLAEMNALPNSSPVCGWIMSNNLDLSLVVYDQTGNALGALYVNDEETPRWDTAPFETSTRTIDQIENLHLRKVMKHIQDAGSDFLGHFIEALDSALASISPSDYAQHRSQALLVGRPIAVVRAMVNLELMGIPAINQDWNIFRQDLQRDTRETNNFTRVKFPIRIGERHQLNDGLVGYWLETSTTALANEFYAAQSETSAHPRIVTYDSSQPEAKPVNIIQAIDSAPQYLTMLVDPRGVVHATSGILPTKSINIPSKYYREVLERLEVAFFAGSILTEGDQLDFPLPKEPGYTWAWLQPTQSGLSETTLTESSQIEEQFLSQPTVREGWLKLRKVIEKEKSRKTK
jgi:hypothetical protein